MAEACKVCKAVGGRIATTCPRCKRKQYTEITPGDRRRIVRCTCGKSSCYSIDYRANTRESHYGKGVIILPQTKQAHIKLIDSSSQGIGFIVLSDMPYSLRRGQQVNIKFRGSSGAMAQRKIHIKNISGNRVGAGYT